MAGGRYPPHSRHSNEFGRGLNTGVNGGDYSLINSLGLACAQTFNIEVILDGDCQEATVGLSRYD